MSQVYTQSSLGIAYGKPMGSTQLLPRDIQAEHSALVEEWASWLERKRYARTTRRNYLGSVRRLLRTFPTTPVEMFTAEHLERYLSRHRSPGGYVTELENLRAWFQWLRKHKRLIRTDPCAGVDPPAVPDSTRPAVLPDQFRALCKATPHLEALVAWHLMYYSGLRVNELRHVKVADVDLERRLLRVTTGKGSRRSGPRERWTILDESTVPVIRLWAWRAVRLHPDAYLLGNGRRPRNRATIAAWFAECRRAAGLPADVTLHSLRHGFIKRLKLLGVSIEVAANLAGHQDLEVTRRVYGSLTPEEMRGIYDRAVARPMFGIDKQMYL